MARTPTTPQWHNKRPVCRQQAKRGLGAECAAAFPHLADLQLLGCRRIVHVNRRSAANAQQHDKVSCRAAVHATTPQTGTRILSSGAHVYPCMTTPALPMCSPMHDNACPLQLLPMRPAAVQPCPPTLLCELRTMHLERVALRPCCPCAFWGYLQDPLPPHRLRLPRTALPPCCASS